MVISVIPTDETVEIPATKKVTLVNEDSQWQQFRFQLEPTKSDFRVNEWIQKNFLINLTKRFTLGRTFSRKTGGWSISYGNRWYSSNTRRMQRS